MPTMSNHDVVESICKHQNHLLPVSVEAIDPDGGALVFCSFMEVKMKLIRQMAGVLALALWLSGAGASTGYPNKPVTIIVPLAAGGGTDIIARAVATELQKSLGQPFIIENRPGAGGTIGTAHAAKQKGDGYTLAVGSTGTHLNNELLYKDLPYKPFDDFKAVTVLCLFNNALIVPMSSPFQATEELIDAARKEPGALNYGIAAIGASSHLAGELFKREAKVDITGVPYSGSAAATSDLVSGRLDMMFDSILSHLSNIKGGKLRALATLSEGRSPALPDVPTLAEKTLPGFQAVGWVALFAPKDTPDEILNRLADAVNKIYAKGELPQRFASQGIDLVQQTQKEFDAFWRAERVKWSKLVHEANIHIE